MGFVEWQNNFTGNVLQCCNCFRSITEALKIILNVKPVTQQRSTVDRHSVSICSPLMFTVHPGI
jgi:hypothetical protein